MGSFLEQRSATAAVSGDESASFASTVILCLCLAGAVWWLFFRSAPKETPPLREPSGAVAAPAAEAINDEAPQGAPQQEKNVDPMRGLREARERQAAKSAELLKKDREREAKRKAELFADLVAEQKIRDLFDGTTQGRVLGKGQDSSSAVDQPCDAQDAPNQAMTAAERRERERQAKSTAKVHRVPRPDGGASSPFLPSDFHERQQYEPYTSSNV